MAFVQLNEKNCITYIYSRGNGIITFKICFGSVNCQSTKDTYAFVYVNQVFFRVLQKFF